MKWLAFIIKIIITVLLLLLVVAIFLKKEYRVEREIVVDRPRGEVFDFLRYQKNQVRYNPWLMKYSIQSMEYTGTDGQVGFTHRWDSPIMEVGKGEEKIVKIEEGRRIDIELHFIRPFDRWSNAWLITDSLSPLQTRVTWGFSGGMKYPLNLVLVFMNIDNVLGDQLSEGLSHVKRILEANHSTQVK